MAPQSPPTLNAGTSALVSSDLRWGRVLLCGGTDWVKLGRKEKPGGNNDGPDEHPDLLEPHILRSLSNTKATSIHTSGISCHCIVLDVDGVAWLFGRNGSGALGIASNDAFISENAPRKLTSSQLGAAKGTRFVHAACGKHHSLLVGSGGEMWTAGANNMGQCGHAVCAEVTPFKLVNGPWHSGKKEHVVQVAAGSNFSIALTESGKVFAFGSGEKGQLGNGRTGEHIVTAGKTAFDAETEGVLVKGLEDKKIVQISAGAQHSIALDSQGLVYVWGYNGYCRLGLGNQQDILIPKLVPQFAGPIEATMGAEVIAGPSNSVVIDKQRMYWMAGKWKNTGDGSSGQPYSSFRYMQDIMACKMTHACCGGVTHWALAPDDDGSVMTIAWGQGAANGELGLGKDEPKSATKPTRHQPLIGIDVFGIAAGQNTTFFLATPGEKLSSLPRHPIDVQPPLHCIKCGKDGGEDDSPLECEKCDNPYHLGCLEPPLSAVPEGEWFCPDCEANPGAPVGPQEEPKKGKAKTGAKPVKEAKVGQKRKAASSGAKSSSVKRKK